MTFSLGVIWSVWSQNQVSSHSGEIFFADFAISECRKINAIQLLENRQPSKISAFHLSVIKSISFENNAKSHIDTKNCSIQNIFCYISEKSSQSHTHEVKKLLIFWSWINTKAKKSAFFLINSTSLNPTLIFKPLYLYLLWSV